MSRAWRIAVTTRSRRVASPRKAARVRCRRSWRRSCVLGSVRWWPVSSAPKVCMSVAARALETPKSRSRSRRVRRSRSSASSWRMASGMARSHRGVAGIGKDRAGYNLCSEYELGRVTAGMLCAMLVDDRPERKIYAGLVGHPIRRVMGRRDQATDPPPAPGAAAPTPGGRRPSPWHRWPQRQKRSSCPGAGRSRASRPR